jgi:cytochrome P450
VPVSERHDTIASPSGIADAARSFDHWDPRQAADPFPLYQQLRDGCPVAHSERHDGFWVLTRYDDVNAALRDHVTFSSRSIAIPRHAPGTILATPPLDQDPPEHTRYRRLLLPYFTPARTAQLEPGARRIARELAARFAEDGGCELVRQYSFPMPTVVLAQILGVDTSHHERFLAWTTAIVEGGGVDPAGARRANREIYAFLGEQLDDRRQRPRDDLLTFLLGAEFEGSTLSRDEQLGIATLLLIAGIDTTANTLGAAVAHLAAHPDDQARLRAEPELFPSAVEELLRAFASVSIARLVTGDVVVDGCPVPGGDQVLLSLPSANHDERRFARADEVVLDRVPNPHLGFGAGIHRCIGHHIARMELRVGLQELLAAVPPFRLAGPVVWKGGPIRGPKAIPLTFDRAT